MDKIEFKVALLDCMSYPISRYKIEVDKPVTEDSVRLALENVIRQITGEMCKIEKEEEALEKSNSSKN